MASILKNLSLGKIIGGINNTMTMVNKAIPIYKQITPIVNNVRTTIKSYSSVKQASNEIIKEEVESMRRPRNNYKKQNLERGNINLDTLTFFQ